MPRDLVTFEVAGQAFAMDITAIREIRLWSRVERLPSTPADLVGIINVRGAVVPVVDLSARLNWGPSAISARHAIIVAERNGQLRGLIVESVSDILSVAEDALQPPPALEQEALPNCLEALAVVEDRMILVLALNALFGDDCGQTLQAA